MLDKGSTMFIVVYCKHAVLAWANVNNLRLNLAKCAEIIFCDSRRKRQPVAYNHHLYLMFLEFSR